MPSSISFNLQSPYSPGSPSQFPLPPSPRPPSKEFEALLAWLVEYPSGAETPPWRAWESPVDLWHPVTQYGGTCLHLAAAKPCVPFLAYLVEQRLPTIVKRQLCAGSETLSPLMLGCLFGDLAAVRLLLQLETDINRQSPLNGWTGLMYCAISPIDPLEKVQVLKFLGADPEVHSWLGYSFRNLEARIPKDTSTNRASPEKSIPFSSSFVFNNSSSDPKKWFEDSGSSFHKSPLNQSKERLSLVFSQSSPVEILNHSSKGLLAQLGLLNRSNKEK